MAVHLENLEELMNLKVITDKSRENCKDVEMRFCLWFVTVCGAMDTK